MQTRNIHRILVFYKALRLHNKEAEHKLNLTDVCILSSLNDGYYSILSISAHLKALGKTRGLNYISNALKAFRDNGFAEQHEINKRWTLTLAGRNALTALEKRCRETRYDK